MALNGFTFWSIVVAYVGSNIVFVIIMNLFLPYKIMFRLDKQIAGELIGYGYKVLLAGLVTFAVFNLDNFVVGAVSGPSVLGYYSLAFNWGSMVCGIMSAVVSNVLFPVFARMQDEPEKLKEKFLVLIRYIAIVCIVWNLTLFCVSDLFLVHVLGKGTQKWLPALNALKILCVYGVVRTIIEFCNTLLMASGNPKLVLKSGIIVAIIEALLIYPAIKYGSIEIVSVLVLLAYMTQAYFTKRYVNRLYNVELKDIIKIFIPSGGAAIVIYASYYIVQKVIPNNLYGLILAVTYVVVAYVLLYGFFTKWKYYSRLYYSIIK
jgi:O-antigen/teichoic acid export membrane protein